ncbi:MAG: flagellar hook-length control protein FliK [Myxococcota bacterium]
MQVERIRSFESDSIDSGRARGNGKSAGFSELMDSVLGAAESSQTARPEVAESRSEKGAAERTGREARETTSGPRKAKRGEERESAATDEAGAKASAAAPDEGAAGAAARDAGDEREAREEEASAERTNGAESDLIVAPAAQGLETAMPIAIPEFEALARGPEPDAASEEGMIELAPELDLEADARRAAGAGALATPEAPDLAEATNGRTAIGDPRAREALRTALEQALAERDAGAEAGEAEGDPAAVAAPGIESDAARPGGLSMDPGAPRADAAPRSELASALRAVAADPSGARSQNEFAGDDSARGREAALARPAAAATPKANAESGAVAAAAIEGATAGLVEAVADADDSNPAIRLDGAPPAAAARAPELPPTMQTGRALPNAAPDAIAAQAEWLATRGGGTARLVLNPPELGEIAIRVTVRQQAVEVVMVAQTALAHSMAEDQGDRLSQAFASRDLRLDQFEVRRGDPSDSNGTGQFGSSDAGARERERAQDERGVRGQRGSGRGPGRAGGLGGVAAPPPRIGSSGGAAGVDLRI